MKRHIQNAGLKKWFGDYLCELESEPLKAVDQWASAYGGCIISGGILTLVSGTTYDVASALVVLKIDGEYKVAPLPAASNVDVSVQKAIRLKKTAITGQYQNPSDLTIAYDYAAEIIDYTSGLGTLNQDYMLIPTNGGAIRSYADVIKDALAVVTTAAKGLMSAADKTKLNGVATNANNYTHPATHPPSIIAQDSGNRFVTDTEKSNWNGKLDASEVVTTPAANKVLKLDGSAKFPASAIAQSSSYRFVTDAEKSTWNSKADGSHNHSPTDINEDSNNRFVTDAQITDWNSKAEGTHGHTAAQITESTSRRFVSDTEKSTWNGKLDASEVVTTPTANKVLKLDASAKFPASAIHVISRAGSFDLSTVVSEQDNILLTSADVGTGAVLGSIGFGRGGPASHQYRRASIAAIEGSVNVNTVGLGFFTTNESNNEATIYERMRLTEEGNLAIGKETAAEKLDVNGNIKGSSFIKTGGTSSQFLKADGSVDSRTFLTAESDTLDSVVARGASTSRTITVGDIIIS